MYNLRDLIERWAHPGEVVWLGLRPERRADMLAVQSAEITRAGCVGDHKSTPGKRAVTLLQA
ncbi:MAG: sulfurase, partial [Pseudomonadota bacterium]